MGRKRTYQDGIIYKYTSKLTPQVYIGSTKKTLKQRFSEHKAHMKMGNYCSSHILLAFEDCIPEIIQRWPCLTKEELRVREQYHMDLEPNCVNENRAIGIDPIKRKTRLKRNQKKYYLKNKEKIAAYDKARYLANKNKN